GDLAGLILASPGPRVLDGFTPTCPVILLDAEAHNSGLAAINLDIESAARDLAAHLVNLGHRRVAYAGLQRNKDTLLHRRDALHAQLQYRGADLVVPDVLVSRLSIDGAHDEFL